MLASVEAILQVQRVFALVHFQHVTALIGIMVRTKVIKRAKSMMNLVPVIYLPLQISQQHTLVNLFIAKLTVELVLLPT